MVLKNAEEGSDSAGMWGGVLSILIGLFDHLWVLFDVFQEQNPMDSILEWS